MGIFNRYLNRYDNGFGLMWQLKKLHCKIFEHFFDMKTIIDDDIPFHVYECRVCGKMSFKTCEDMTKKPIFSRTWFSQLMFDSVTLFLIMYGIRLLW